MRSGLFGLASAGTGGSTASGEPSCTNVTATVVPCGGDLVGTWTVTPSCLSVSGELNLSLFGAGCPSVAATGFLEVTGTWTANSDGTYSDDTITSGDEHLTRRLPHLFSSPARPPARPPTVWLRVPSHGSGFGTGRVLPAGLFHLPHDGEVLVAARVLHQPGEQQLAIGLYGRRRVPRANLDSDGAVELRRSQVHGRHGLVDRRGSLIRRARLIDGRWRRVGGRRRLVERAQPAVRPAAITAARASIIPGAATTGEAGKRESHENLREQV
jgi:hypothetical protein